MHLTTILSAVALAAGGVEAARRDNRGGAHGRRMGPGHMYKSKNHQRMHSAAPFFVEPSVSIDMTTSSKSPVRPPAPLTETMTVAAPTPTPSVVLANTTVTVTTGQHDNHRGHGFPWGDGFFKGPWKKTSTCSSGLITITETVNITVSVTASTSLTSESGVDFHRNYTHSWPHHPGNGTTDCISTTTSATWDTASSSTWTSSSHTGHTSMSTSTSTTSHHHYPSSTESDSSVSIIWPTTSCNETTHTHSHPSTAPSSPSSWSSATTTTTTTVISSLSVKTILVTLSSASPRISPSDCVIDPLVTPALTAFPLPSLSPPSSSSSTPSATSTVCALSAPSGKPNPGNTHCGVRGRPISPVVIGGGGGDKDKPPQEANFLARFTENSRSVPATLQGCWQICAMSEWGVEHGCAAYAFIFNNSSSSSVGQEKAGGGVCDLFGQRVASSLAEVNNAEEGVWFDLECGDPRVTGSHALEGWERGKEGDAVTTTEERWRLGEEGQGGW